MGIFSTKVKTTVSSVTYPLMGDGGDPKTPDYMEQTVLHASMLGYDVTQRINSYILNGRYFDLLRAFKEAKRSYPYGLPTCKYVYGSKEATQYGPNEGVDFGTQYMPNLIARYGNQDFLNPELTGSFSWFDTRFTIKDRKLYDSTEKILKHLGIPAKYLREQINNNKDVKEIDHAFVVTAINLATETKWGNQYLYEFFKKCFNIQQVNKTAFDASLGGADHSLLSALRGVPPKAKQNMLLFRDSDPGEQTYFSSIEWNYITRTTESGTVGDGDIGNVSKSLGSLSNSYNLSVSTIVFKKQIATNKIEVLTISGLVYRNNIYKDKYVEIDGFKAISDKENNEGFLIPVDMDVLASLPVSRRHQLCSECLWMVFNCAVQTKKKWYQRGAFGWLLTIVALVVSYFYPPAVIAAQSIYVAMYAVAVAVLIQVIIKALPTIALKLGKALGLSGDSLQKFVAAIVIVTTIVAMVYGGGGNSIKGAFSSMNWLQATNAILAGVSAGAEQYVKMEMQELQNEAAEFQRQYEKAMEGIEALWDHLTPDINTGMMDVVQSIQNNMKALLLDTPEVFLRRTLLTGQDIVNFTFLEIEKFVEGSLRPELIEPVQIPLGVSIERQLI